MPTGANLGLGYGVALWLGNVVIGWNLVLVQSVLETGEAVDPLAAGPVVDHRRYGVVLGVAYAAIVPRLGSNDR